MSKHPPRFTGRFRFQNRAWNIIRNLFVYRKTLTLVHKLDSRIIRLSPSARQPTALDVRMMQRALELARKATEIGEVPIGALVHRDGQIIAETHNLVENPHDPTGHAELRAIQAAAKRLGERRLNECTLVVTLEPCAMCAGGIVLGRVGRVVYGATDPKAGAIESVFKICTDKRLNHQPEIVGGVLAGECGKLLSDFFKERRRINKDRRAAGQPRRTAKRQLAERRAG